MHFLKYLIEHKKGAEWEYPTIEWRPALKQEVKITTSMPSLGVIYFYATNDAIDDFREFGFVRPGENKNYYCLEVDARYDFDEVLKYIQNYDTSPPHLPEHKPENPKHNH